MSSVARRALRLVLAIALLVVIGASALQVAPRPIVAGTWFCAGVRPVAIGICVDDPI